MKQPKSILILATHKIIIDNLLSDILNIFACYEVNFIRFCNDLSLKDILFVYYSYKSNLNNNKTLLKDDIEEIFI